MPPKLLLPLLALVALLFFPTALAHKSHKNHTNPSPTPSPHSGHKNHTSSSGASTPPDNNNSSTSSNSTTGSNSNSTSSSSSLSGWTSWGGVGLLDWSAAMNETTISPANVGRLHQLWNFTITENMTSSIANTSGGWSSRCTSTGADPFLYCTSWSGGLYAFDRTNGSILWFFNITTYLVSQLRHTFVGPANEYASRASPSIDGDSLYVTTRAGAYVLCLHRLTGKLTWSTRVSTHPYAFISTSIRVYKNLVYTGVASSYEDAVQDGVTCCPFRGSFVALNAQNGSIAWEFFTIPDNNNQTDSWGGGAIFSSLAPVDVARNEIIISTGNLYSVPSYVKRCLALRQNHSDVLISDPCRDPADYSESVVALSLETGAVQWVYRARSLEVWTSLCGEVQAGVTATPHNYSACPALFDSVDVDFGQSPLLIPGSAAATPDGQDALVVCQKSGVCHCISAQAGQLHWAKQLAPGGVGGGFEFGSATNGTTLFYADTNSAGRNYTLQNGRTLKGLAHFGAIDIATAQVLWETPLPVAHEGAGILQGVTYANGVVFGGSNSPADNVNGQLTTGDTTSGGHLYALDASTGEILLDMKLDKKSCYAPSIIDGVVYVPCGYSYSDGTFPVPATLYALGVDDLPSN